MNNEKALANMVPDITSAFVKNVLHLLIRPEPFRTKDDPLQIADLVEKYPIFKKKSHGSSQDPREAREVLSKRMTISCQSEADC